MVVDTCNRPICVSGGHSFEPVKIFKELGTPAVYDRPIERITPEMEARLLETAQELQGLGLDIWCLS